MTVPFNRKTRMPAAWVCVEIPKKWGLKIAEKAMTTGLHIKTYTYIHMYIKHTYTYMHMHSHICTYICVHLCVEIPKNWGLKIAEIGPCVFVYVLDACVCVFVYTCIDMHMCTYMYAYCTHM